MHPELFLEPAPGSEIAIAVVDPPDNAVAASKPLREISRDGVLITRGGTMPFVAAATEVVVRYNQGIKDERSTPQAGRQLISKLLPQVYNSLPLTEQALNDHRTAGWTYDPVVVQVPDGDTGDAPWVLARVDMGVLPAITRTPAPTRRIDPLVLSRVRQLGERPSLLDQALKELHSDEAQSLVIAVSILSSDPPESNPWHTDAQSLVFRDAIDAAVAATLNAHHAAVSRFKAATEPQEQPINDCSAAPDEGQLLKLHENKQLFDLAVKVAETWPSAVQRTAYDWRTHPVRDRGSSTGNTPRLVFSR